MKTLSKRNYLLISMSMQTLGFNEPADGMMYEEQMYCSEADEIWKFLEWLHKVKRPFGPVNYQKRWKEFIKENP